MPVSFVIRRGKTVGMNMTFAEMRHAYNVLTGRKIPVLGTPAEFESAGAEMMTGFTRAQITAAVESFDRERYVNGPTYC